MSPVWVLDAVSDDWPCGPDLDSENDSAFLDYYYEAESRLPERYFVPGLQNDRGEGAADRIFDPKTIDLRAEISAIEALLKRSRDVRLLSLLARFQILAGRVDLFAETLDTIAALLEQRSDYLHPLDASARRAALEDLGAMATVVMPLQHVPLNGQPEATLRRMLVAEGNATARAGEGDAGTAAILSSLADMAARPKLTKTYDTLAQAVAALDRIQSASRPAPNVHDTRETLAAMIALIARAAPALKPAAPVAAPSASPAPLRQGPEIHSLPAARAIIEAVERYLAENEPSSPALLLVTQARLLIGRPLIEALETLLPEQAAKASIGLGGTGFVLKMDRLRALSAEAGTLRPAPVQTIEAAPLPRSREEAGHLLHAAEDFFRRSEPASPIPVLVARARQYLDKDFEAIVADLIPTT